MTMKLTPARRELNLALATFKAIQKAKSRMPGSRRVVAQPKNVVAQTKVAAVKSTTSTATNNNVTTATTPTLNTARGDATNSDASSLVSPTTSIVAQEEGGDTSVIDTVTTAVSSGENTDNTISVNSSPTEDINVANITPSQTDSTPEISSDTVFTEASEETFEPHIVVEEGGNTNPSESANFDPDPVEIATSEENTSTDDVTDDVDNAQGIATEELAEAPGQIENPEHVDSSAVNNPTIPAGDHSSVKIAALNRALSNYTNRFGQERPDASALDAALQHRHAHHGHAPAQALRLTV